MLRKWLPLWAVPVLVIMSIGTVWLRLTIVRTSYSIDQMNRQLLALRQAREQMEVTVTSLRSPRRLELLARTRFGLSQPQADQLIRLAGPVQSDSVRLPASGPVPRTR